MTCKEFVKLIPDYVDGKLDYGELKQFSEHMQTCPECKEELVIQFLVTEGIKRLEDGKAFDLNKELAERMEQAQKRIEKNGKILKLGISLEAISVAMFVVIFICLFL